MKLIPTDVKNLERKLRNALSVTALLIFTLSTVQFSACQTSDNSQMSDDPVARARENQIKKNKIDSANLAANRRLWEAKQINHYRLTVSADKGGNFIYLKPALIEVEDNQINSISFTEKSREKDTEMYQKIGTIEKLYNLMQQELDKGGNVTVKYNKEFGYPEDTIVEFYEGGIDGQIHVVINKFEVIN